MTFEWNMEKERQIPIKIKDKRVFIDKDIAPFIEELNEINNPTLFSCSGTEHDHPDGTRTPYIVLDLGLLAPNIRDYIDCLQVICDKEDVFCTITKTGEPLEPVMFNNNILNSRLGFKINFKKNANNEIVKLTDEQLQQKFNSINTKIKEKKCHVKLTKKQTDFILSDYDMAKFK